MSETKSCSPLLRAVALITIAGCGAAERPNETLQRALAAYRQTADRSGVRAPAPLAPDDTGASPRGPEPRHEQD
jgi:hypothetical protein